MNMLYYITKLLCACAALVIIALPGTALSYDFEGNKAIDGVWGYIVVNDSGHFQNISIVDAKIIERDSYADKWPTERDYTIGHRFEVEDPFPFEGTGCFSSTLDAAGYTALNMDMSVDTNRLLPPLHGVPEASTPESGITPYRTAGAVGSYIGYPALQNGANASRSAYWHGSRLFAMKNDQWLMIAPNTIAYVISKKYAVVELKPDSKNMSLPMRLGNDPFIDYNNFYTVAVSSCAFKGTIYISTNLGAIATISLGEKPAWSKAQQPFGVSETRLFSDGYALYAFTRKQEKDDWQIYRLGADDKWVETKFAKLPAARTPLYVSENYFVTSSTVVHPWLDQWIPQKRVDICHWNKDKGWGERAITMEPQGIVMDIAENEKTHALHILTGQEQKDTVNLSIQQTVFKFPSAEDDKVIVAPPAEGQARVD